MLGSEASTLDFVEDGLALGLPDVALGVEVALSEVGLDRIGLFAHMAEAAFADDILGKIAKETLQRIHPRRRGRREMQRDAREPVGVLVPLFAPANPAFHLRVVVRDVAVNNKR